MTDISFSVVNAIILIKVQMYEKKRKTRQWFSKNITSSKNRRMTMAANPLLT